MDLFDWIFVISGFIFFISMIISFLLMSRNKLEKLKWIALIFAILLLPLTATLVYYIIIGKEIRLIIYISLILAYLIVELLLDIVLKIDFRSKLSRHIPYIILEYAACFSYVYATLTLNRTIGWIISSFFWVMLLMLAYYIIKKSIEKKKQENNPN